MSVCQDDDEDEKDKGESAADGSGKTKKKKKKKKKAAEEAAGQVTASENSHKHSAEKAVLAHSFRQIWNISAVVRLNTPFTMFCGCVLWCVHYRMHLTCRIQSYLSIQKLFILLTQVIN